MNKYNEKKKDNKTRDKNNQTGTRMIHYIKDLEILEINRHPVDKHLNSRNQLNHKKLFLRGKNQKKRLNKRKSM